jgi:hypothetical protein
MSEQPLATTRTHGMTTDVLVDEDDANVLSVLGESVERRLDRARLCLAIDDQEVLLRICTGGDMLDVRQYEPDRQKT